MVAIDQAKLETFAKNKKKQVKSAEQISPAESNPVVKGSNHHHAGDDCLKRREIKMGNFINVLEHVVIAEL